MTPETKAKEIMVNFITETIGMPTLSNKQAQACAILHCQGIVEALEDIEHSNDERISCSYEITKYKSIIKEIEAL